jgi:hypothetical protein
MAVVGPDGHHMDQALRLLERSHDDGRVRDALGRRKHLVTDAITGLPVAHYVYRLDCGHLITIFLQPLPSGTTYTYCEQCDPEIGNPDLPAPAGRERLIVEQLLQAPEPYTPPPAEPDGT